MKKSKFDLSHLHSTTLEMGKLVPFYLEDCLPNDTLRISMRSIIRAQPMIAPLMHEVRLFTQYFFVPYRLLWDEWIPFITGGESGEEAPSYPVVTAPAGGWKVGSLADYFGFPVGKEGIEVSALPFRAMAKIWNDHYLKDDIDTEVVWSSKSGKDNETSQELLSCHWSRDRYIEAKPFTQRGPQVSAPVIPAVKSGAAYPVYSVSLGNITLGNWETSQKTADVVINYTAPDNYPNPYNISLSPTSYVVSKDITTTTTTVNVAINIVIRTEKKGNVSYNYFSQVVPNVSVSLVGPTSYSENVLSKFSGGVITATSAGGKIATVSGSCSVGEKQDLGSAGAINIIDLRTAAALQRVQEASMKYGSNYEDYVLHEFKMKPRDSRLQKSEYIGGGSSILQISEVLQTSEGANSGVGSMAGHGIASLNQRRIRFRAPEHGCIIGLMSIRPATVYTQGIERAWLKRTRWEFFTKELADIGAQEILQQELYADKDNASTVFGYDLNGNYREYRSRKPMVTGNFRSDLNYWNLARFFDSAPVLNSDFCKMNPSKRPFAITDSALPAFICMLKNIVYAYRPIPKSSRGRLV